MRGEGPQRLRMLIKSLVVLLTLVMARASKSKGDLSSTIAVEFALFHNAIDLVQYT